MNTTYEIDLTTLEEPRTTTKKVVSSVLPFLGNVKVKVEVRVGTANVSVAELAAMQQGAVITLDEFVDQPLDIVVDGHVVARGSLVAVGDQFGVRLTETPASRAGLNDH